MNELKMVTLAKLVKSADAKIARNGVESGRGQRVRFTISVDAILNVAEDYMRTPTVSIPFLDAMILVIHDAGITGKAAVNALVRGMTRAINLDEDAKAILAASRENLGRAEAILREGLEAMPAVAVKGPVTFEELNITEIEPVAWV